jgi:hypothetical protein
MIAMQFDTSKVSAMMKDIKQKLPHLLLKPLYRAADTVRGISQKEYLRGPRPDKLAVATGRLFGSLRASSTLTSGGAKGEVVANAVSSGGFDYPGYWELRGTRHGGPRPFLRPARDEHKDKWMQVFNQAFKETFEQWQNAKQY